jgi:hypothetical protein
MNLAINDRRTSNVTALFVVLGILFGVSVAFLSAPTNSDIKDHKELVDEAGEDVLIVLRADKVLAAQLQAALEQMRELDGGYRVDLVPTDRRIIVPLKQPSRQLHTIDI